MKRIALISLIAYSLSSLVYVLLFINRVNPHLWILLVFFGIQFTAIGFLFGNLRALAMQPIGHIAGVGAAINGFISTVMGVFIANSYWGLYRDYGLAAISGLYMLWICFHSHFPFQQTTSTHYLKRSRIDVFNKLN
jgi:DHA1 family bicyclomycin/chloramphenicol resistance-like MFS transporter